jgi:magnesium chelatase subunit I
VEYFPKIEKLQRQDEETPYDDIVSWFFNQKDGFELLDDLRDKAYQGLLKNITPLDDLLGEYQPNLKSEDGFFMKEFVLWALAEYKLLSKQRFAESIQFKDPYGSFIGGI